MSREEQQARLGSIVGQVVGWGWLGGVGAGWAGGELKAVEQRLVDAPELPSSRHESPW